MLYILYRRGSVVVDFALNFQQTGNETVLPRALKVFKDSVQNTSSIGDLEIDPASLKLEGNKLQIEEKKNLCHTFHVATNGAFIDNV